MARQFKSDVDRSVPSKQRVDDLVRTLRAAQADARMLKAKINEAERRERSTVLRNPKRRQPKRVI